jgi:hypothetical protein
MRNHRTTEELERIVGLAIGSHSPRLVASAQRELRLRSGNENELFDRKLSRSGSIAAWVGVICIVWPLVLLVPFAALGPSLPPSPDPNAPFLFRSFSRLFTSVALLQAVCGCLLLVGGLGLRARKRWAPFVVSAPIIIAMAYDVVFTAAFVQGASSFAGSAAFGSAFAFFALLNAVFSLFLLWLPLRFFWSPRVKQACSGVVA